MFRLCLLFAIITLMLAGCASQSTEIKPPEIAYGQDLCDECGMLIDNPQFAAALILENGETRTFDDIGEMFTYVEGHADQPVRAWFAHDYYTEAWLNAESAHFVMAEGVASPMGIGIAAFEAQSDAQAFAIDHQTVVLSVTEAQLTSVEYQMQMR